jgi:hypothetical protein
MDVPIVQVLFSFVLFLDLEVVDQFLPLPLHNLYLAGSLGGSISLCIIMGLFPHDLSCIHSFCWFAALFSVCCWCFLSCAFAVNDACLPEPRACLVDWSIVFQWCEPCLGMLGLVPSFSCSC